MARCLQRSAGDVTEARTSLVVHVAMVGLAASLPLSLPPKRAKASRLLLEPVRLTGDVGGDEVEAGAERPRSGLVRGWVAIGPSAEMRGSSGSVIRSGLLAIAIGCGAAGEGSEPELLLDRLIAER